MNQKPSERIHVLVVWEPILPTDWLPPGRIVKSRINDPRVTQFWDRHHLVAQSLSRQTPPNNPLHCCRSGGILWDVVAFYPQHVPWENASPEILEGPVVESAGDIAGKIASPANSSRF